MSLEKRLADAQPSDEPVASTVFDGADGYIQTGPLSTPPDYDAILREFGYDPAKVSVAGHPRISKWQQRARIRGTNEYETTWLTAYKFTIQARGFAVDLPALYAEVARTKPPKPRQHPVAESTIVVCWADIQVGKTDHLGSLTELLQRLSVKRELLKQYLRKTPHDRIVIADCGDIIEGFSNFPAQHRTNSLSLMDQIDVASTELWQTIKMACAFAPVDVLAIPSNHCAWRRDGKSLAGKPGDDWGLHINQRLERQNAEVGLPARFHRPDDWSEMLQFDVRDGVKLGLAHGHQVSNPDQIKTWWAKMSHAGVLDCDILLTGHFHFASLRPTGRDHRTGRARWHIQAPTLDNGSAWVRNKIGEDGDPSLLVFAVNRDGFDVQSFRLL